jgi:hypothetical protein
MRNAQRPPAGASRQCWNIPKRQSRCGQTNALSVNERGAARESAVVLAFAEAPFLGCAAVAVWLLLDPLDVVSRPRRQHALNELGRHCGWWG